MLEQKHNEEQNAYGSSVSQPIAKPMLQAVSRHTEFFKLKNNNMNYELLVAQLNDGKMPNVTGLHFTPSQAAEIEKVLNGRKKQMDDYYSFCVAPRIIERSLNVTEA